MKNNHHIVVLSGGVGGARFLQGLTNIADPDTITVICNTGDDREFYGLYVSPDIDIVMYTLAGIVNQEQGWGIEGDTYYTMQQLRTYGNEIWFHIGDRDFATHIHRTQLLRKGKSLTEITAILCKLLGVTTKLLPMSNQSIQTHIQTPQGLIHFEEYLVKYKAQEPVEDIVYVGSEDAGPTDEIIEAIKRATTIIIGPSNPLVSIGSILSVRGIREALLRTHAKTVAISPLIYGKPVRGPADKLMEGMNMEVSSFAVAKYYQDLIDTLVIDNTDREQIKKIESLGVSVIATNTLMRNQVTKETLAKSVLFASL